MTLYTSCHYSMLLVVCGTVYCLIISLGQGVNCCRQQWRQAAIDGFQELFGFHHEDITPADLMFEKVELNVVKSKSLSRSGGENARWDGLFSIYTDASGCYNKGKSDEYCGSYSMTESGQVCMPWAGFTKWLRGHLKKTLKSKEAKMFNTSWASIGTHDYGEEDAILQAGNETIREMDEKGLVHHNYCRDFDGNGRPWCFVKHGRMIMWESCGVPACTRCWSMRQRVTRHKANPKLFDKLWLPHCDHIGRFSAIQCWDKYCWCSRRDGKMVRGSLRRCGRIDMRCGVRF